MSVHHFDKFVSLKRIDFYNKNSAEGVGKLIHKRDLIAINKALKLINNEK